MEEVADEALVRVREGVRARAKGLRRATLRNLSNGDAFGDGYITYESSFSKCEGRSNVPWVPSEA